MKHNVLISRHIKRVWSHITPNVFTETMYHQTTQIKTQSQTLIIWQMSCKLTWTNQTLQVHEPVNLLLSSTDETGSLAEQLSQLRSGKQLMHLV